jgi:hypothetical protein
MRPELVVCVTGEKRLTFGSGPDAVVNDEALPLAIFAQPNPKAFLFLHSFSILKQPSQQPFTLLRQDVQDFDQSAEF